MQQIAELLEKLGMSEYVQRFAENDVDVEVLTELTDADFDRLGVSIGHRRKIIRASRELAASPDSGARERPPPAATAAEGTSAERRQVTVMFSDLVGSTALSAQMDPEDLREVISAYQECAAETVRRFGGFVARYMGDGVLAYFGYPEAHEDDAERAVRAGLGLIAALAARNATVSLQTRVGIATGLVVVGDIVGSGEAREHGIVGETPNLAARLQGIAEPNSVVIAEGTRRLLGNLFELQDLGPKDFKGIPGAIRVWTALRPAPVESRFEALHPSGVTELVGRGEELEILLRRWSDAKSGQGQVVLLSGEPGIGKSRLTAALLERVAPETHRTLRYFCSPQHTDSALYPIISQMERCAGFTYADSARGKLDKLESVLAGTSTSKQDAALFAEMLSLTNDGRFPTLELTPQQRRQRTFEALAAQVATIAQQNPALMIFEDAHWADPTSLEAFARAVDRIKTHCVLLLITSRPELELPWIGEPHVTVLTINRLTQREVDTMIDRVVANGALPADIRQDIIERTDGIPLFVEEMTKAVLEAESERQARQTIASSSVPAVPASLHASLMARLDRLGPAKDVAQIGAALGREFSHAQLAAAARKPEAELQSALDRIIAAGLLFRQGVPPDATYLFKHALVQDAAYGTLLREPRRALHARVAETLESSFTDIAENQPEILARHCTEAGLVEKAAGLWGKAARRSLGRSAFAEAIAQVTRALTQISTLSATPGLRRQQIAFQIALIYALMSTKGMASPETAAALKQARVFIDRAEALGEAVGDPEQLMVLNGFWLANHAAFNGDALRELAARFLALAEKQGAIIPLIRGHRLMGVSLMWTGEIVEGHAHFDRAVALCDRAEGPRVTRTADDLWVYTLSDLRVYTLSDRSMALWTLGYPDAALADVHRVAKEARDLDRFASLAYALATTSRACILCGSYAAAKAQLDEAIAWTDEKGAGFWKALIELSRGCVLAMTGKASDAVPMLTSGITAWRSTGSTAALPMYLSDLAIAHADSGQLDDAQRCIDEAIAAIKATKETIYEAEIHRIAGDIALKSPRPDAAKAERNFNRALAIARAQQTKSWELRAATSMARLWRDQGRSPQARELLAPVHGWFTEGFETIDLKQARSLLAELASEGV
jgi:class 3 adenylate cyclase/predicted ATPase